MSKPRTAAEQQIEMLRQMKESKAKRRPTPTPVAPASRPALEGMASVVPLVDGAAPSGGAFELSEAPKPKPKAAGPSLPLSRATWRRLKERQAATKEFPNRKAMGDWAAELLLALPGQASRLDGEAKAELFKRLREWAEARGLR